MIDLDAVQTFLEAVWPIYEAAEDWQEDHQHACDARCTAVNHIPELTSYLSEAAAELRAAREIIDAVVKYDDDDRDRSWDRIEVALNRYDDLTGEATDG